MLSEYQISLTNRQIEELAKFSLDISKLSLASLVLGAFTAEFTVFKLIFSLVGLTIAGLFLKLGLDLFKEAK